MQENPPTITTVELHRLVARAEPLWLIYAPDDPRSEHGHIPGSLATSDADLLAALPAETPMVVYGDSIGSTRAQRIAGRFAEQGRDIRWYAGGVQAWTDAGHPTELA